MSSSTPRSPLYDTVVIGAGIGGLAAAVRSAELGQRVLIIEKSDKPGGSAAMSAGILWTAPDIATLEAVLPDGDQELCGIVVREHERVLDRVRASGVTVSEEWYDHLGWGRACKIDIQALIALWAKQVSTSAEVVYRVSNVAVEVLDEDLKQVTYHSHGTPRTCSTRNVILATGGIQGDPMLRQLFIGAPADKLAVRSNPGSVGDGFRLGSGLGGSASKHLSAFYGHTLPSPLRVTDDVALRMTLYFSSRGIVINRSGRRFSNEGLGDEVTTQALVHQPAQRAVLIWDDKTHHEHALAAPYPSGMVLDRHEEATRLGARTAKTDSLEELLDQIETWDVDAATAQITLDNYTAAAAGKRVPLDAPIPNEPAELLRPPFRAMEVQPCITLPFGGLAVDQWARVLDRDGQHVNGLFAVGGDAGGMQDLRYVGGILFAIVYGLRSAEAAAGAVPEMTG